MRYILFILFATCIIISSCGEPRQERIQRLVDKRLHTERLRLEEICRNQIIDQASSDVDSVIIVKALSDTSNVIVRPVRPAVPNLTIPDIDTLGIKPLFEAIKVDTSNILQ